MDKWLVVYIDLNTWNRKCGLFNSENEAREYANERLEKQKEYTFTDGKVYLFPPNTSVEI